MRPRTHISAAGVIIVILIALVGFAAVSAETPEAEPEKQAGDALPASLSARVAAASFSAALSPEIEQEVVEPDTTVVEVAASPQVAPAPAPSTTTTTTTTTRPPTTTTTTTAAPAPTTTTTTPPTTTTTAPPATTTSTTAPPPTTTEPPTTTTTAPPDQGGPRDVEEWRTLVEEHFAADLIEGALTVIQCESRGDPSAYNPVSGASGLFQFIPSTWAWAAPNAGFPGASPFEPAANVGAAAWLVQRSINQGKHPWAHWSCRP